MNSEVLITFKGDTKDIDNKTKSLNVSIGSIAKGVLAATGVTKALSSAWQMVSRNMGTAINRYDTLQNFPKVMKNFGVSSEEAAKSVDRIADSVLGLPTSLDQAVSGVQNIFMVTKDLKKAEAMFQAVNDSAMVFANGSTEAVDRFIYAYKQALSSGKVMAQDFNQMNEAIPGLMDKVAESMGVTFTELKEGLSKGTISTNQFNEALKKLDTEGVGSMGALRDSAFEATGGIGTAIKNMNSRISAGLASMIEAVNKGLKEAGIGDLATIFSNVGSKIKEFLVGLAPYITQFIVKLSEIGNWINKNKDWLQAIMVPLLAFVGTFSLIAKVISIVKGLSEALTVLKAAIAAAGGSVTIVIALIVALVAGFMYLWNHCEGFRNFWIGLWEGIKNVFFAIVNWIKTKIKETVEAFNNLKNNIKSFVNSIVGFFTSLPGQLYNIGKNMLSGLWNGINSMKNWVVDKVKGIGKSILNGLKGVLGIHSPSKEFAIVGRYSILGYTKALDDMQTDVQKQIAETFSISPQLSASSGMHFSPNIINNNYVDIQQDPLGQMVNFIKTYSGGAKNDYNYGAGF